MENQKEQTITYGLGRFIIDIPASMQYSGASYSIRTFSIKEDVLSNYNSQRSVKELWDAHLVEIDQLTPPDEKEKALIEAKKILDVSKFCTAVFYYKDYTRPSRGYIDLLLDAWPTAVWISSYGKITGKDFMYEKSTEIAKAYRPPTESTDKAEVIKGRDSFYLRYGAVDLPFEYEESARIHFEGHSLDQHTTLTIESDVVHEVETVGLIDRFKAAFSSGYAQGLKAKKIRAQERIVAGENGEEYIYLGTEDDDTKKLNFLWESPGQAESGNHPELAVTMMCEDGQLKEKLVLWDAILDSMRPAAK